MQIVINISDAIKEMADEDDKRLMHFMWMIVLIDAIKNGVVLPKGHGDLIDRKELLKQPIDNVFYPSNYVRTAPPIIEADKESEE